MELHRDDNLIDNRIKNVLREKFHLRTLYPYQELVIRTILESARMFGHNEAGSAPKHQLVVLPTGSGKSVCFMLPSLLVNGITIAIYPLLSLMNDQARRMKELGVKCAVFKGGQSTQERNELFRSIEDGSCSFIITNPETLGSASMLSKLCSSPIALIVIDEAHTVVQWGETFRPAYLDLPHIFNELHPDQILAFTATASPQIIDRITDIMFKGRRPHIVLGNPDRPNITYKTLPSICKIHDIERLFKHNIALPAVIFCSTRKRCETVAWELKRRLNPQAIRYYHAGLDKEEREATEKWFYTHPNAILCCTSAYGMGVDKKNIRSVIHYDLSTDAESFLQESGRAGRDNLPTTSIVIMGIEEQTKVKKIANDAPFVQLCTVFMRTDMCRRKSLLKIMGYSEEHCSGCDVCDDNIITEPEGSHEILSLIRCTPFHYTKEQVAFILSGNPIPWRLYEHLSGHPLFGILDNWEPEDIQEGLQSLQKEGAIKVKKTWPFKNRLYVSHVCRSHRDFALFKSSLFNLLSSIRQYGFDM
ncbi:MAG: RecQ family ATP-dependent DNA helicase [Sphaerochaetaceae bacterium]|nr:RecQ family ATP-dependent DNA helicase [Sphaerochaetaceae bacterium]